MPDCVVLTNVRLDNGKGLAVDGCTLIIDDDRIATANGHIAGSGDQVVDLQGRTVAFVTGRDAIRDARAVAAGRERDARRTDDVTDPAVMPRIWSWPPARLWPPTELM
jgi:hypothetical protein